MNEKRTKSPITCMRIKNKTKNVDSHHSSYFLKFFDKNQFYSSDLIRTEENPVFNWTNFLKNKRKNK